LTAKVHLAPGRDQCE